MMTKTMRTVRMKRMRHLTLLPLNLSHLFSLLPVPFSLLAAQAPPAAGPCPGYRLLDKTFRLKSALKFVSSLSGLPLSYFSISISICSQLHPDVILLYREFSYCSRHKSFYIHLAASRKIGISICFIITEISCRNRLYFSDVISIQLTWPSYFSLLISSCFLYFIPITDP